MTPTNPPPPQDDRPPVFTTLEEVAVHPPQFLQGYMTKLGTVLVALSLAAGVLRELLPDESWTQLQAHLASHYPLVGMVLGALVALYGRLRRRWRTDVLAEIIQPSRWDETRQLSCPWPEWDAAAQGSTVAGEFFPPSAADISGPGTAARKPGAGVPLGLVAVLLAGALQTSCATQNSPIQQAIAERIKASSALAPAMGMAEAAGGRVVTASPAFQQFFSGEVAR